MPTFDEMYNDLVEMYDIENKWDETMGDEGWCKKANGTLPWIYLACHDWPFRVVVRGCEDDVRNLWNHYCKPKKTEPTITVVDECSTYGQAIKDLFSHHDEPKWLVLYKTNPEFAKAAQKLAWKLAHALATSPKGTIVRRRKSQSPTLFIAALSFLFRNTRGTAYFYTDDNVELA